MIAKLFQGTPAHAGTPSETTSLEQESAEEGSGGSESILDGGKSFLAHMGFTGDDEEDDEDDEDD